MTGDSEEVERRIEQARQLVRKIATNLAKTLGPSADIDELESCGREAAVLVARKYDPERSASTYENHAKYHLERAMRDGFRRMGPVPRRIHEKLSPTAAQAPGAPAAEERAALREKYFARLNTAQAEGLLGRLGLDTQGEFIAVSPKTQPDVASQRKEQRELLERAIAGLPPEEAAVVRLFLEEVPMVHIAARLGIDRETAQNHYDRALARLQKRLARPR